MSRWDVLRKKDRNQAIIKYALDHPDATQREIAGIFGITHQRVSLIMKNSRERAGKEKLMARRRMIDSSFFEDDKIGALSKSERILLLACVSHADDDGRLRAHPGLLRAMAFPYDDEDTSEKVKQYRDNIAATLGPDNLYAIVIYKDDQDSEYLAFINWSKTNKPGHPKASDIPAPPDGNGNRMNDSRGPHEDGVSPSGDLHDGDMSASGGSHEGFTRRSGEGRGGQSSQGKVRLGKVSRGNENSSSLPEGLRAEIEKFLSHDLTDFDDLIDYEFLEFAAAAAAGKVSAAGSHALTWWETWMGELNGRKGKSAGQAVLQGVMDACRQHPPALVAAALLKAGRYEGGAQKSWTYAKKIMAEMNGNAATGPP